MDSGLLVPIVLFIVIGYVIKVLSDNRVRRILIEKGEISENTKYLFADKFAYAVPSSLKWGMVLIAVGLAFVISQIFPFMDDDASLMALLFIFGGGALVAYYFVGSRMLNKKEQNQGM